MKTIILPTDLATVAHARDRFTALKPRKNRFAPYQVGETVIVLEPFYQQGQFINGVFKGFQEFTILRPVAVQAHKSSRFGWHWRPASEMPRSLTRTIMRVIAITSYRFSDLLDVHATAAGFSDLEALQRWRNKAHPGTHDFWEITFFRVT